MKAYPPHPTNGSQISCDPNKFSLRFVLQPNLFADSSLA
jgi:hypothetical protein